MTKAKFKRGTTVIVTADLSFKGLIGVVEWSDTDENGDIEYLLKFITHPEMKDQNGKPYRCQRIFFYESWLSELS
jgi:hypothetical protein